LEKVTVQHPSSTSCELLFFVEANETRYYFIAKKIQGHLVLKKESMETLLLGETQWNHKTPKRVNNLSMIK
jgi:hypothetical protein